MKNVISRFAVRAFTFGMLAAATIASSAWDQEEGHKVMKKTMLDK